MHSGLWGNIDESLFLRVGDLVRVKLDITRSDITMFKGWLGTLDSIEAGTYTVKFQQGDNSTAGFNGDGLINLSVNPEEGEKIFKSALQLHKFYAMVPASGSMTKVSESWHDLEYEQKRFFCQMTRFMRDDYREKVGE